MPTYKGTTKIVGAYKGNTEIESIYKGVSLVYTNSNLSQVTGVPPLSLTNCKAGSLVNYQVYGNTTQSGTPTYTSPLEINSLGTKSNNLLNPFCVNDENKYINYLTGELSTPAGAGRYWRSSPYIAVTGGSTYYFNEVATTGSLAGTAWYDENLTYIGGINATTLANRNNFIALPSTARYIRHSFEVTDGVNPDWQNTVAIVKSSTAVPYEPYNQYTTSIIVVGGQLYNIKTINPLSKVGDYADYIDFANQRIVRNVGIKMFDGTENWEMHSTAGHTYRLDNAFNDLALGEPVEECGISTHLSTTNIVSTANFAESKFRFTANSASTDPTIAVNISGRRLYAKFSDSFDSVADLTSFLASEKELNRPVTLIYPLSSPVYESVVLPSITVNNSSNTIAVNNSPSASSMYVKYKSSI